MPAGSHSDISSFLAVAQERSFTKAAARLGMTPSALSHAVRNLEDRLGLRLLNRTTRNVAPTEAGARLIASLGPLFEQIDVELGNLGDLRDRPGGKVRITCNDYVIETIFRPRLQAFLNDYPEIEVEFSIDYGFTDIIEGSFDAGVRLGDAVSKDMIAMRIGPDFRQAIVGSPAYLAAHGTPETPRDLTDHKGVVLRLPTSGGLYPWTFAKKDQELTVRIPPRGVFNSVPMMMQAALDGVGLASLSEDVVADAIADRRLVRVLADWPPVRPSYHLYYPSRRQPSPAFSIVLEALRTYRSAS